MRAPAGGGTAASAARWTWFAAPAIALVTAVVYARALTNDFVDWDDPSYVTANPLILSPTLAHMGQLLRAVVSNNFHPLTMLTLWMNAAVSGVSSASAFIATNVALHVAATVLVFAFVRALLMGRSWIAPAVAALLFGLHPMHVESVAWVAERKDVLYVTLFLAACCAGLRVFDGASRRWLVTTYALFVLACLAKAMAVVFPLALLLLADWRGAGSKGFRATARRIPLAWWAAFFATSVLFGAIALDVQAGGSLGGLLTRIEPASAVGLAGHITPLMHVEIVAFGFCAYLFKLALPIHLSAFYPYPSVADMNGPLAPMFIGSVACAIVIVTTALILRRRRPAIFFGVMFYTLAVALVLQGLPVGQVIMADRYAYLSSIGPFFMLGIGAEALARRGGATRAMTLALATAAGIACAVLTHAQIAFWHDTQSLWTPVIARYPGASQPYWLRGNWYAKQGRLDAAIGDLETSLRIDPRQPRAIEALGVALGTKGNPGRAMGMFDRAIAMEPNHASYYFNRAVARGSMGDKAGAIKDLHEALRLDPRDRQSATLLRQIEGR